MLALDLVEGRALARLAELVIRTDVEFAVEDQNVALTDLVGFDSWHRGARNSAPHSTDAAPA